MVLTGFECAEPGWDDFSDAAKELAEAIKDGINPFLWMGFFDPEDTQKAQSEGWWHPRRDSFEHMQKFAEDLDGFTLHPMTKLAQMMKPYQDENGNWLSNSCLTRTGRDFIN